VVDASYNLVATSRGPGKTPIKKIEITVDELETHMRLLMEVQKIGGEALAHDPYSKQGIALAKILDFIETSVGGRLDALPLFQVSLHHRSSSFATDRLR
jgi:hypothetical protein